MEDRVEEHVEPERMQAARIIGHLVLAALLGPYVMSVAFGLLEFTSISTFRPEFILFNFPSQILVFGFPVIFLFTAVSFIPLLAVLRVPKPSSRRTAFLAAGASLGLLVGGCLGVLSPSRINAVFLVAAGIFVGVGCGYLDWLIWKPRNPSEA